MVYSVKKMNCKEEQNIKNGNFANIYEISKKY